ncbi:unnamed protein product [Camellia sinensis]
MDCQVTHLSKAVYNQLYKRLKVKTQPFNSFCPTKLSFICFKKLTWLHDSWEGVGLAEVVGTCKRVTVHDEEGKRGRGDAEDDSWEGVRIPALDYACGYRYRFGKRHFFMPKYYRVQGGSCMESSDNQTGYDLSNAARLKWPALFIERVQMERLCERLQREISQMRRRLARDMQLYIVKKDAQKNRIEPNVAAIKGITEDPELVSDAELSDYSDSEPPADLSAN